MRKKRVKTTFAAALRSLVKRYRKEGEQSSKPGISLSNIKLELLALLTSGVTEELLDLGDTRDFRRPIHYYYQFAIIITTNLNNIKNAKIIAV